MSDSVAWRRWFALALVAAAVLGALAIAAPSAWTWLSGRHGTAGDGVALGRNRTPSLDATARSPWFGGYVDVTAVPPYPFENSVTGGPVTTVLAFIVARPGDPCEPSWGGEYTLDRAGTDLSMDGRVAALRAAGSDVAVSFGGQLGAELGSVCTDVPSLAQAYARVIDRYGLKVVDLDVEGTNLADRSAGLRRAQAIARVQGQRGPGDPLQVWLTLPVSPSGLEADGVSAVKDMLQAGVDVAGVNIMTMDYDQLGPGQSMLGASIGAAEGTHRQLLGLFSAAGKGLDSAAVWQRIGITPMLGVNDVAGQTFGLEAAQGLNTFAQDNDIGRLSVWSLNRDKACPAPGSGQAPVTGPGAKASDSCSGIAQQPGSFARLLGAGFTAGQG